MELRLLLYNHGSHDFDALSAQKALDPRADSSTGSVTIDGAGLPEEHLIFEYQNPSFPPDFFSRKLLSHPPSLQGLVRHGKSLLGILDG